MSTTLNKYIIATTCLVAARLFYCAYAYTYLIFAMLTHGVIGAYTYLIFAMLNHGVMGLLPPRSFDLTSMYINALSQTKQNMNNAGKGLELLLLQNILFFYY